MFGKLTLDAVPYHEPIIVVTVAAIIIGGAALLALITYFGKWSYLWNEWLTSVDHKKLGIMYCIVGIVMLIRGFADAIMMRSQQALASAGEAGFLPPHHYDQIFTAHGVIMIFFVAMPFVIGLMNLVVPLQIGARDVAFPFLNNLSFLEAQLGRQSRHLFQQMVTQLVYVSVENLTHLFDISVIFLFRYFADTTPFTIFNVILQTNPKTIFFDIFRSQCIIACANRI